MADLADIRLALANLILAAVYPNGTASPSTITGLTGKCAVYQNDPKPEDIDTRVQAGDVLISIADLPNATSTTRFTPLEIALPAPTPTLAWSIAGNTLTLAGTILPGRLLALVVNRVAFNYTTVSGDTINTALNQLAVMVALALQTQTFVDGSTLSIPDAFVLSARIGVVHQTVTEVGRQVSRFEVRVMAARDALRSAAVKSFRAALDRQTRVALPDSTTAWLKTSIETSDWRPLKLGIATSCLIWPIEWPTILEGSAAELIGWTLTIQGGAGSLANFTANDPPVRTYNG